MRILRPLLVFAVCVPLFALPTAIVWAVPRAFAQSSPAEAAAWHAASRSELQTYLPARAPVVTERIETEMPAASGIINNKDQFIGGVVLITAGYSADGKYSHYFVTQVPLELGSASHPVKLAPGNYLIGYVRQDEALQVRIYEAASGKPAGDVKAVLDPAIHGVTAFRIWPPSMHRLIQIGRFTFPYRILK
ncbi:MULTISPECIES: hypothetical protein [Acidobacterium]|uniref:Uncharacterized protein n=1 Tax=Acidobacterium capsulatum (strain ATCC 51196 / DSM 11244 / BCRC 80197 / JCM 7670 / NBRC 15755 / NCIMB 13165 / 161) TaxID=240015 RepID=C1F9F7_ACIC5|nr:MULTISPECIES: hypothetical protein [Acidobacterium]ACO32767.1 hypothetical protein ACP_2114 [Acidobacterium capsulatum ATCC 51196]